MNLIDRAKNILFTPKTEWEVIDNEIATSPSLLTSYVLPLALLAAAGSILKGLLFAGPLAVYGFNYFIVTAIVAFIASVVSFYLSVYVIDLLAPSFASEKNLGKSAQLVAYSSTASYIAGFLSFIPYLGFLIVVAGWVYGIYLTYLGLGPLKKTPEDKKVIYMIIAFIIMIVVYFIIAAILGGILLAAFGFGAVGRYSA